MHKRGHEQGHATAVPLTTGGYLVMLIGVIGYLFYSRSRAQWIRNATSLLIFQRHHERLTQMKEGSPIPTSPLDSTPNQSSPPPTANPSSAEQIIQAQALIRQAQEHPETFLEVAKSPEYEQALLLIAAQRPPEAATYYVQKEHQAHQRFKAAINAGESYETAIARYLSEMAEE